LSSWWKGEREEEEEEEEEEMRERKTGEYTKQSMEMSEGDE